MSKLHKIDSSHLTWRILRLTEKAISLVASQQVDDALACIDNRERAMNLLASRGDVSEADALILKEVDKLNAVLLECLVEAKEKLKSDIAHQHKHSTAHKAYHPNQVK